LFSTFPWKSIVLESNTRGRDFIVGDVHGELGVLIRALESLNFDKIVDRLFSVGDLIDRGPDSARIVEFLGQPWFYAVVGNHEQFLLDNHLNRMSSKESWYNFGGRWWDSVSRDERTLIASLIKNQMFATITVGDGLDRYGLVHADVPENISWEDFRLGVEMDSSYQNTALWSRDRIRRSVDKQDLLQQCVSDVEVVFCGHTSVLEPLVLGNVVYLDTGSGYIPGESVPDPALTLAEVSDEIKYYRFSTF
jgi:serine/threonine protein phosphatase 1